MTNPTFRYSLTTVVLLGLVGCSGPATSPAPHRVGSIAISVPTEITGPGVVRAGVDIRSIYNDLFIDTVSTTVTTTGPLTATWEVHGPAWYRALRIVASGPGSRTVTVSADG